MSNGSAYSVSNRSELEVSRMEFKFAFSSDAQLIEGVTQLISKFCVEVHGCHSPLLPVVLNELLSNAIHHGNRDERDRLVHCTVTHEDDEHLKVTVQDEGDGFEHAVLTLAHPEYPSGVYPTGLVLVQALADEVVFSERGTKVTARIRIGSATPEHGSARVRLSDHAAYAEQFSAVSTDGRIH